MKEYEIVSIPLIGYAPFLLMKNMARTIVRNRGVNSLNRVRSISTEHHYEGIFCE